MTEKETSAICQLIAKWRQDASTELKHVHGLNGHDSAFAIAECANELQALLSAAGAPSTQKHRCSRCGHRWEGQFVGAELCGDCWRKIQPPPHLVHPPQLTHYSDGSHDDPNQEPCPERKP